MKKFLNTVVSFAKDESGPTAVEYAVMLALIIVVCITAVTFLGTNASNTFSYLGSNTGNVGSRSPMARNGDPPERRGSRGRGSFGSDQRPRSTQLQQPVLQPPQLGASQQELFLPPNNRPNSPPLLPQQSVGQGLQQLVSQQELHTGTSLQT